jgi:hypothetical protein
VAQKQRNVLSAFKKSKRKQKKNNYQEEKTPKDKKE